MYIGHQVSFGYDDDYVEPKRRCQARFKTRVMFCETARRKEPLRIVEVAAEPGIVRRAYSALLELL